MMSILTKLTGDKKAPVVPLTLDQKIDKALKLLSSLEEQIEELKEQFADDNWREERKELKAEIKTHTMFMQQTMLLLVESKKAADSKPSVTELYMQRKAAEAEAEKNKPNGARPRLPG